MFAAEGESSPVLFLLPLSSINCWLTHTTQRYEHTFAVSEKVEGRIDFPLSLNMLPYTTAPNARDDRSKYIYDLSTAVVHKGKLDAGHYYCYCRQGDQVSFFLPLPFPHS